MVLRRGKLGSVAINYHPYSVQCEPNVRRNLHLGQAEDRSNYLRILVHQTFDQDLVVMIFQGIIAGCDFPIRIKICPQRGILVERSRLHPARPAVHEDSSSG